MTDISKPSTPMTSKLKKLSNEERSAPTVQLALLLHSQQLGAWLLMPGQPPKVVKIKGETCLNVPDAPSLASAHASLSRRLRDSGLHITHTLWLVDAAGRQWIAAEEAVAWQLPWEWLAQRFSLGETSPWDAAQTLQTQVLPWLTNADDAAQRQRQQQTRESEHASETERLAAERAALTQENEHLRACNAALQQVDAERLVSFLPALYPRVFTIIGPADLALLCGRVEPFNLPNPYPEPVEETLRTLQKRFRALPRDLQKQIASFVADLPQRQKLQSRPEMRELIEELMGL